MKDWKEYKERRDALNYFRQNNDQFLSTNEWIKTIVAGVLAAILMGIAHGAITTALGIDFSVLYIVIGFAVANIVTSVSGITSKQMGIASAIITFIAFFTSRLTMFVVSFPFSFAFIPFALKMMFTSDILDIIFIVVGIFVAYQQSES